MVMATVRRRPLFCVVAAVSAVLALSMRGSLGFVVLLTPRSAQLEGHQAHLHNEQGLSLSAGSVPRLPSASATPPLALAAFGVAALAAVAMVARGGDRDESLLTRYGRHDRRTFRGKQHGHTFGKFRLRKGKQRRLKAIRDGAFDPEKVEQHGQPEPEHCWDPMTLMNNKNVYLPDYVKETIKDAVATGFEYQRSIAEKKMGKYGNQDAYKNWTPGGGEEKAAAAAFLGEEVTSEDDNLIVAAAVTGEKVTGAMVKELRERSRAGILDCQKALKENGGDMEKAMEWLKKKGVAKADKKAGNIAVEGGISSYVHFNKKIAVLAEVNCETDFAAGNELFKEFAADVAMQVAANPAITCVSTDNVPADVVAREKEVEMAKEDLAGKPDNIKEKIVEGRLKKKYEEMALMNQKWLKDEDFTVEEVLKQRIAKLGENIVIRRFSRLTLGEGLEKKDDDFAAGVEAELAKYKTSGEEPAPPPKAEAPKEEKKEEKKEEPAKPKVEVSAAQVKELRQRSGAGIMDSKKALAENEGDMEKAMDWLKKKGIAKADKKVGNQAVEGGIASYVHFNRRLGVIVEVNSQTDFVGQNAIFKEFASDVAMQIAANPTVQAISVDDLDADVRAKEKATEMAKEDLAGKPENIKEKIVEGRLRKKFEDLCLMSQKWLKDEDKTVQDVLKEKIAKLGENLVIRRFERLTLGEGLEKGDADFAAGVEKELEKYRA